MKRMYSQIPTFLILSNFDPPHQGSTTDHTDNSRLETAASQQTEQSDLEKALQVGIMTYQVQRRQS
jgi:hypothetical protein